MQSSVAIIGGGYAGMAAAVKLAQNGFLVTIFEAANDLGGRARRVIYNDTVLDNGLHILIGAYRQTLELIKLVNVPHNQMSSGIKRVPLTWNVLNSFTFKAANLPSPFNLLLGLLSARGTSLRQRWQIASFMQAMARCNYRLQTDKSVCELLETTHQSHEIKTYFWYPLCEAALNTAPQIASAQIFLNVLNAAMNGKKSDSDIILASADLSTLFPDKAAAYVKLHGGEIRTRTTVEAVEQNNGSFSVKTNNGAYLFDHIVCAVAPHQLIRVIERLPKLDVYKANIAQFSYQPIHSIYLQYPSTISLPAIMFKLPDGLEQWVFDRERICGQKGLIGNVLSASEKYIGFDHQQLARTAHESLKKYIINLPEPVWRKVIAEKRATFAATVGITRPAQNTPLKNFYLAGDYTDGPYPGTIEAAVQSGIKCAELILNKRSYLNQRN